VPDTRALRTHLTSCNNAAISFPGDLRIVMKRYDLMMDVNVRAPFLADPCRGAAHARAGGGAVLNISSAAALYLLPGLMIYGMTKAALERLSIDAAQQLAPDRIAVNTFPSTCPCLGGVLETLRDADPASANRWRWRPRPSCGWCASRSITPGRSSAWTLSAGNRASSSPGPRGGRFTGSRCRSAPLRSAPRPGGHGHRAPLALANWLRKEE